MTHFSDTLTLDLQRRNQKNIAFQEDNECFFSLQFLERIPLACLAYGK